MNLVAVTACPTGIAHSQMGAESLERAAAEAGHDIEVEVQGAMGTENELTAADIERADVAIVAADVRVEETRFSDLPTVVTPVRNAVTDPDGLVERAVAVAKEQEAKTVHLGDDTAEDGGILGRLRGLLE
ncbi:PTS fructose transporter subunit IIB [Halorussus halophilus]|uniref:PTS fructose transporter subunit IIB n=1 Tax=Halorussus halophilus TaxID=2650975 RepID=UPI00130126EE|nr:fructose PTS transporter subunit IIB [Halorussus halophilus]